MSKKTAALTYKWVGRSQRYVSSKAMSPVKTQTQRMQNQHIAVERIPVLKDE
jgi:hypothetical protein